MAQLSIAFGVVAGAARGHRPLRRALLRRGAADAGDRPPQGARRRPWRADGDDPARDRWLLLAGLMLGGALSAGAVQLIASRLYGLSPADPSTFAAARSAPIAGRGRPALAAWLPAYRASRVVDPLVGRVAVARTSGPPWRRRAGRAARRRTAPAAQRFDRRIEARRPAAWRRDPAQAAQRRRRREQDRHADEDQRIGAGDLRRRCRRGRTCRPPRRRPGRGPGRWPAARVRAAAPASRRCRGRRRAPSARRSPASVSRPSRRSRRRARPTPASARSARGWRRRCRRRGTARPTGSASGRRSADCRPPDPDRASCTSRRTDADDGRRARGGCAGSPWRRRGRAAAPGCRRRRGCRARAGCRDGCRR